MSQPYRIWNAIALIASVFLIRAELPAQTLARPGWVGSGLTAQTWFKHAILYEIDTRTFSDSDADGIGDLKGITQRLDYIHSLSIDAILFKPLSTAKVGDQPITIDRALGTLDDFDDLTLQASRLKIRVLLELTDPDPSAARFWLTRGVAGFYIPGNTAEKADTLQPIRKLLPTYVGQRILITDAALPAIVSPSKSTPNELVRDRGALKPAPETLASIRASLEPFQTQPRTSARLFEIDSAAVRDPQLNKIIAAALLLNRSASLILAGQELGFSNPRDKAGLMPWGQATPVVAEEDSSPEKLAAPITAVPDKFQAYVPYVRPVAPKKPAPPDPTTAAGQDTAANSLLNFYRELGRLHHGASALRDGEEIILNHDDRNALIWIRRPASPTQINPPALIACNLSGKPVVLSLKADLTRLQLRGNVLKTVLRSDDLTGAPSLDPITLPPYGVYIGNLRY